MTPPEIHLFIQKRGIKMKIALIGAGSRSFGTGQIIDIFTSRDLKGKSLTLSLVDENESSLERASNLALKIQH
jgi:alpha-galactosidase/6-phospho-beta-glucosidase family protein